MRGSSSAGNQQPTAVGSAQGSSVGCGCFTFWGWAHDVIAMQSDPYFKGSARRHGPPPLICEPVPSSGSTGLFHYNRRRRRRRRCCAQQHMWRVRMPPAH